jgi:serine protease Do
MRRWSLVLACLLTGSAVGLFVGNSLLQGQGASPPAIPRELTSYRDIVKKVLPAVVSIESRVKPAKQANGNKRRPAFDDSQIPEEFRRFFEQMPDAEPQPSTGFGSGFLIDPKGVILTNNHVVDGADELEVQLRDGRKFVTKDFKTDSKTDLAIVRINAQGTLPYLEMGDSDAMEVGDRVLAVGAPFGLTGTVTAGIVSAKNRDLHLNSYEDYLQTDAAINPGNSGGPLVNLEGKVIGINSAIKSRSGGWQGVGMAIPSKLAAKVMRQLVKDGVVHRGYLGVQIRDVNDPELATRLGLKDNHGVLVSQVFDNAPAAKGGMQSGDVITAIAGHPVKDGRDLRNIVAELPLNKPVDVAVVRDGKPETLKVTVEEQPADYGTTRVPAPRLPRKSSSTVSLDKVGLEVQDLTPEVAEKLGYKGDAKGAVISRVDRDGPAAAAGLRAGMVITRVDKQPVESAQALRDKLSAAALDKGVLLQVQSPQGGTDYVLLKTSATANR